MRNYIFSVAALAAGLFIAPAQADVNVFACEPEWGALVSELAGDKASLYVATTGMQDPHQIQARPSLIAKARAADLTVCTGAELEIGWLPMVLQQAANSKIKAGTPGSFEASKFVQLLDVPTRLDRAGGYGSQIQRHWATGRILRWGNRRHSHGGNQGGHGRVGIGRIGDQRFKLFEFGDQV